MILGSVITLQEYTILSGIFSSYIRSIVFYFCSIVERSSNAHKTVCLLQTLTRHLVNTLFVSSYGITRLYKKHDSCLLAINKNVEITLVSQLIPFYNAHFNFTHLCIRLCVFVSQPATLFLLVFGDNLILC